MVLVVPRGLYTTVTGADRVGTVLAKGTVIVTVAVVEFLLVGSVTTYVKEYDPDLHKVGMNRTVRNVPR
jgi:hypothetical protein